MADDKLHTSTPNPYPNNQNPTGPDKEYGLVGRILYWQEAIQVPIFSPLAIQYQLDACNEVVPQTGMTPMCDALYDGLTASLKPEGDKYLKKIATESLPQQAEPTYREKRNARAIVTDDTRVCIPNPFDPRNLLDVGKLLQGKPEKLLCMDTSWNSEFIDFDAPTVPLVATKERANEVMSVWY